MSLADDSMRAAMEDPSDGRTCAEAVYETLKKAILEGKLAHGQVISQVKLSKDLAVSRTPVREAIRMLQAEGWVESEPNKRVRVAPVAPDSVEQFYAMRITLEAMAVGFAVPRMDKNDFTELENLLRAMRAQVLAHDYVGWEEPHKLFHRALTRHAGDVIQHTCTTMAQATTRYRSIYMTGEPSAFWHSETDHMAIFEACVDRDAGLASALLAKHLARTAIQLVAMLDPGRDPTPVRAAVNLVAGHLQEVSMPAPPQAQVT
ncbi:MAG: transcriptional regulator, GntR family [Pseudonocardiales bacterium]|nr:transcriptional regulator, GntR family [Pseudonocardiales bacterium]